MTPSLTLLLAHFKCHLLENYSIQGNGSIRSRPGSPRRRWRARWRRWLKRRWGNSTTSSFLIFGNIMHFSVGDSYCGQWPLGPTPKIWDHPRCRCWIFWGGIPSLETSTEKKALALWQNSSALEELLKLAGQDGRRDATLQNDTIKPVVLQSRPGGGVHPSLKERQQKLIDMLYSRWVALLSCPKNAEVKSAFFLVRRCVSSQLTWTGTSGWRGRTSTMPEEHTPGDIIKYKR